MTKLFEIFFQNFNSEELDRLAIVAGAFFIIILLAEFWHRWGNPPAEWTRKFIHISCGIIVSCFHWIFSSPWIVFFLGLVLAIFFLVARHLKLFKSLFGIERNSLGDLYYILAILALFNISYNRPVFYFISILTLTISDALAALLGSTYQKTIYTVENHFKSLEGSVVFFLSTFLIVHIPLLLLTDMDRLQTVLIGIQASLVITCLEAICLNGIDNFVVPVATYFVLIKLMNLPSSWITWQLMWQFALITVLNILAWRFKFLSLTGVLSAQLFLFGAFTLGDPTWTFCPLIALALFSFVYGNFHRGPSTTTHKIYQVKAVCYICLIPAVLFLIHNIFERFLPNSPEVLKYKDSFYVLYVAALSAQAAIAIYRLYWLYCPKWGLKFVTVIVISCVGFIVMVPLSLWIQFGNILWEDVLLSTFLVSLASSLFFFLYNSLSFASTFPWEFRLQAICVGLAAAASMPLYLYREGVLS